MRNSDSKIKTIVILVSKIILTFLLGFYNKIKNYISKKIIPIYSFKKSGIFGYMGTLFLIVVFGGIASFIKGVIFSKTNPDQTNIYIPLAFVFIVVGVAGVFVSLSMIVRKKRQRRESEYTHSALAYAYIFPAVISFMVLVGFPLALGIMLSLTNYSYDTDIHKIVFPQFGNYINIIFQWGDYFWNSVFVTFMWTFINVLVSLGLGGTCALILARENMRCKNFYKGLLILPWAVPVYVTAFIWSVIFLKDFGIINRIFAPLYDIFPIDKINWLRDTFISLKPLQEIPIVGHVLYNVIGVEGHLISFPFISTLIVNIWLSFPFMMLVVLSALKTIPDELYEAAEIDGATTFGKFIHITWPLIKPIIFPAVVLNIVWTFNQINIVILMFTNINILIGTAYWLFDSKAEYALASAYSIIIFGILLLYIIFAKKLFRVEKIME